MLMFIYQGNLKKKILKSSRPTKYLPNVSTQKNRTVFFKFCQILEGCFYLSKSQPLFDS